MWNVERGDVLVRYREAGSDHNGYYYVKRDNPNPSNMEIIEGLQF